MKQTLILGLALAANAMTADQVDNELIVAPSGGKFGDLGKFTTKMSRVMFDEQADDELLIRPVVQADDDEFIAMLLPREHFKTEEEYQKYVARMRFSRDDAADDELLLQYHYTGDGRAIPYNHHFDQVSKRLTITKMDDDELFVAPQGKLADLAKKYPGMIMFDDEADSELVALEKKRPLEESKHAIFLRGERERERKLREQMKLKESDQSTFGKAADDEELFYSPEGRYPHKLNGGVILADDELLIRPVVQADDDEFIVMLLPREHFKTEEEYQKYVAKMRFHRDDADDELLIKFNRFNKEKRQEVNTADHDDELFVAPQGKLADLAKKYPGMIMFDDDELVALEKKRPLEESKHAIFLRGQRERERKLREQMGLKESNQFTFGKAVDDEELFYSPEGRYPHKLNGAVMRDEVADDELRVRPLATADDELLLQYHYTGDGRAIPYNHHFDRVSKTLTVTKMDDDELFVAPQGKLADLAKKYPGMIMFDEEADSELLIRPIVQADDDEFTSLVLPSPQFDIKEESRKWTERTRYARPRNCWGPPLGKPINKDLVQVKDDELRAIDNLPRDEFGRIVRPPYARFDEVADDELVYLGNLMKYLENEKIVAAAAHTFDDDELRAEKASHVKAQEMKQIKSEMPKMKRKMRPADETAFLA